MRPRKRDFVRAYLRSFSIQGSWNHRTMTGFGVAFALSPLLERIHADDPAAAAAALERHAGAFNAHPYLASVALGALARTEYEGEAPGTQLRLRAALSAPLGALGDRIVWAGWRPFCVAAAAIAFLLGVEAVAAAAGFLVLYNTGHLGLRVWGLRCGWRAGLGVGAALGRVPFRRVARVLLIANLALIGALTALLIARMPGGAPAPWVWAVAVGAGLMGYVTPRRVSGVALASLLAACAAWLL